MLTGENFEFLRCCIAAAAFGSDDDRRLYADFSYALSNLEDALRSGPARVTARMNKSISRLTMVDTLGIFMPTIQCTILGRRDRAQLLYGLKMFVNRATLSRD